MAKVALVLEGQTFQVSLRLLVMKCERFEVNPDLLTKPYAIQSRVKKENFQKFIEAICDKKIEITEDNYFDLELLCQEFQFTDFLKEIEGWMSATSSVDRIARREILKQERIITVLQHDVAKGRQEEERQQKEIKSLQTAIKNVEKLAEEYHTEILTLKEETGRQKAAIIGIQQESKAQQEELRSLKQETKANSILYYGIQEEVKGINEELTSEQSEIIEIKNMISELSQQKHQIKGLQNLTTQEQRDLAQLKEELNSMRKTLQNIRGELSNTLKAQEEGKQKQEEFQVIVTEQNREMAELEDKIWKENSRAKEDILKIQEDVRKLKQENARNKDDLCNFQAELAQLKEASGRQESEIASLKVEDERHRHQLKAIPKMAGDLSNFQAELARLEEQMEKWEQAKFSSDRQPTSPVKKPRPVSDKPANSPDREPTSPVKKPRPVSDKPANSPDREPTNPVKRPGFLTRLFQKPEPDLPGPLLLNW